MKIEIDKPVIPQFVADWIERLPAYYNVRGALDIVGEDNAKDILDWCRDVDNYLTYKTLVTAYLYGYEVEQAPLYYAKIKGWELATSKSTFWNYRYIIERPILSKLYVGAKESVDSFKTKMTKEEWNKLGINETNADFEKVEVE